MDNKNILVVDDELLIRDLLYDFFAEKGWDVSITDSAIKGLEMLKNRTYDMALVDLKMPEMDGMSFIQKLRALYPELSVIIITAFPNYETAVEALRLKIDDYITKPFNINKLYKRICSLLDNKGAKPTEVPTRQIH